MPKQKQRVTKNLPSHIAFSEPEEELIEILDENSRPLMVMPRSAARAQKLPYQVVLVVVRNREGNIYLHKRSDKKKSYAGLWSVSASGLVKAGEALEDGAFRELEEELGVSGVQLFYAGTAEACEATDWGRISLFLSAPANVIINPAPEEISEGMFVDEDELAALLRDMPEMLTPALKWAATSYDLFNF